MARRSLTEIANANGTDKGTVGPSDAWGAHNYTDVYAAYLERLRDRPLRLLEIGLGVRGDAWDARIVHGRNRGGASLRTWYEYFPRAEIVGVDVNPAAFLDNDRIRTFVADQGDPAALRDVVAKAGGRPFDVVLDDGSHRPDHQQVSLDVLLEHVVPGGLYFIEDLVANGRGDGVSGRHACPDVLCTRRVLKHFAGRGSFPEPHALARPGRVAEWIDYVSFHVPAPDFRPDSETLCAIQRR